MARQVEPRKVSTVRYVLDGRQVPKGTPGAERVVTESRNYYAHLVVNGKRTTVALKTDDLGKAWAALERERKRIELEAAGLGNDHLRHARRPLKEHIADWIEAVTARDVTAKHVGTLRADVERLAEMGGWRRLPDITPTRVEAVLARLQHEPGRGTSAVKKGRSAQTRNHYLAHLRQFLLWCVPERLVAYPLKDVRPISVEADRRHDRRSPADAEVAALFEYLARPDAPAIAGMTAQTRALGYRVSMATGFRAGELRSLTPASFDLGAGTVTVRAGYSKRRRADTQHLPPWLVAELREALAGVDGPPWAGFPAVHPGQVLKLDLEAAGVPYEVPGPDGVTPLYFDFHSLRHWYCTAVANLPGLSPRTLLALTRHSTVELAMKVYAKAQVDQVRAAAHQVRMPAPPPGKPTGETPPPAP